MLLQLGGVLSAFRCSTRLIPLQLPGFVCRGQPQVLEFQSRHERHLVAFFVLSVWTPSLGPIKEAYFPEGRRCAALLENQALQVGN